MSNQDQILEEIKAERLRQDELWGVAIDDGHTVNDWVSFITMYAGQAVPISNNEQQQRRAILKVATLAVAALEAFDRNSQFANRHYDLGE